MWRSQTDTDRASVDCIACGSSVLRSAAREYDKEGDRWSRHGKEFEHLCKDCHDELCHQSRTGLESLLLSIESTDLSQEAFLTRYFAAVKEEYDSAGAEEQS